MFDTSKFTHKKGYYIHVLLKQQKPLEKRQTGTQISTYIKKV